MAQEVSVRSGGAQGPSVDITLAPSQNKGPWLGGRTLGSLRSQCSDAGWRLESMQTARKRVQALPGCEKWHLAE
jgi:hypothetical protein